MLAVAKFSSFALLLSRLVKIQIIEHFRYRKLADDNARRIEFIIPKRGNILDRNSISFTKTALTNKIIYFKTGANYLNTPRRLLAILNKKPNDIDSYLRRVDRAIKKNSRERIILAKNLTREEIIKFEYSAYYLNGAEISKQFVRAYVLQELTPSILGYVSRPTKRQIELAPIESKKLYQSPDYMIGQNGVEKLFEGHLSGVVGLRITSIDSVGNKVSQYTQKEAINGKDIKTTIDYHLQKYVGSLIEDKNGAISVVDLRNGNILAMHSTPSFDPSSAVKGFHEDEWLDLGTKRGVFFNKNISISYPPGSTFKIVAALVALKSGLDPNKIFHCTGEYKIGNRIFHCWKKGGHGDVDFKSAIAQSCNCYFYKISTIIDIDDVYDLSIELGLGRKVDIGLEGEKTGFIPNRKWKRQMFGQVWLPGENANTCLGQGFVEVTPLQLLLMISRVATGRMINFDFIYDNPYKKNITTQEYLNINQDHLNLVRDSLFAVFNQNNGVAHSLRDQSLQICGKTGSAQVVSRRIENEDMKRGRVKEELRSHAIFVGYAPYENPQFAVSVVIEHGIAGALSGAPVAVKALKEASKLIS